MSRSSTRRIFVFVAAIAFVRLLNENISFHPLSSDFAPTYLSEKTAVVWIYPDIPQSVVDEIHELPSDTVLVCPFCAITGVATDREDFEINLQQLTEGTPYESFILDHSLQKVKKGTRYMEHIQAVAILSLVSKNEGIICARSLGGSHSSITVCKVDLMKYSSYDPNQHLSTPFQVPSFNETFNLYGEAQSFSALSYDSRVKTVKSANSGDEVQSLAAMQFIPHVTSFVDRDSGLSQAKGHLIANSWYGAPFSVPQTIAPTDGDGIANAVVLTSMHFQADGRTTVSSHVPEFIEYTRHSGPIGARDRSTLNFLRSLNIPSYLSLCVTLTTRLGQKPRRNRNGIYIVDVNPKHIPREVMRQAIKLRAPVSDHIYISQRRFEYASNLLRQYAGAQVVITSRIHSALPSLAMGTPVIFVDVHDLPGGLKTDGRTSGLDELFHIYRPNSSNSTWTFDLDAMTPNPGVHQADRARASFWHRLKTMSKYYDKTSKLFGMVPFRRLGLGVHSDHNDQLQENFHFIITSELSHQHWNVVRAVEAVFYHHPNAKVTVHSNALPIRGSPFEIFFEVGYDLHVRRYDVGHLLRETLKDGTLIDRFVAQLPKSQGSTSIHSYEADLLRMLVMYIHGGVYLDTDVYVVKPISKKLVNVLAWADVHARREGAIMAFEPRHPMMYESVKKMMEIYRDNHISLNLNGSSILTELYISGRYSDEIIVLGKDSFPDSGFETDECFTKVVSTEAIDDVFMQAFAFHMKNKAEVNLKRTKIGTICDAVLHRSCIFCNEMHSFN